MSHRPAPRPRALARQDVADAIAFYRRDGGSTVALAFIEALAATYRTIAAHPRAGSPRYAHDLGIPGLRAIRVGRFPFLVFNLARPDHVDVWRVLHAARDIPMWLSDPDR